MSEQLIEAIGKTAVLMGTQLTGEQVAIFAGELSKYPVKTSVAALRAVSMIETRLCMATINKHLVAQDGRPTMDEAWALFPKDEEFSGAVTVEMSKAWGACSASYYEGDTRSAEIAFKREYKALLESSRVAGEPCKWSLSPGFDPLDRERVAVDSALANRISVDDAMLHISSDQVKLDLVKKAHSANLLTSDQARLLAPPKANEDGQKRIKLMLSEAYKSIGE